MADRPHLFTIDEIGDLFGLSAEERSAIVKTLRPESSQLRHPEDLLTDEERESLHADLALMARRRQVPLNGRCRCG